MDKVVWDAGVFNKMIAEAMRKQPKVGSRKNIIDYISNCENVDLDENQIDLLLECGALGYGRDVYYKIFDRVVSSAKRRGDIDLVKKVYDKGIFFLENSEEDEKKRSLMESGIEYLLDHHASRQAGELYIKLSMSYADIHRRLQYCEKAMQYLNKATNEYACAAAIEELLKQIIDDGSENTVHYFLYGQTIRQKEQQVLLAPWSYAYGNPLGASSPYGRFFNVPIIKGYYIPLDPIKYKETDRIMVDGSACVSKDVSVHMQDGKTYQCCVFRDTEDERAVDYYYVRGIGLVCAEYVDEAGKLQRYELCEHQIQGGEGLFPLCIGNKWVYQLVNDPTVSAFISRKIVAADGERYFLSGMDRFSKQ